MLFSLLLVLVPCVWLDHGTPPALQPTVDHSGFEIANVELEIRLKDGQLVVIRYVNMLRTVM